MENYFELFEAAELRAPTVVRAEIAELKQKIEKAQKNLIDIDNRIAGYSKDTDPKHANTVANKIRSAEREKKETTARVDDYNKRIKELEEEVRAYFRQKAEKEIDRSLGNDQENSTPPKKITVSYGDDKVAPILNKFEITKTDDNNVSKVTVGLGSADVIIPV